MFFSVHFLFASSALRRYKKRRRKEKTGSTNRYSLVSAIKTISEPIFVVLKRIEERKKENKLE